MVYGFYKDYIKIGLFWGKFEKKNNPPQSHKDTEKKIGDIILKRSKLFIKEVLHIREGYSKK